MTGHVGQLAPELFAETVCSVSLRTPPGEHHVGRFFDLDPREQQLVEGAVPKRKAEFADARWCAHQALARMGRDEGPVLHGTRGMPLWPQGVCGSITHTEGFRAAVVASQTVVAAVGIDAEPAQALPSGVLQSIASPKERERLRAAPLAAIPAADRLLFCVKEAVFKAWFPLTRTWLGFEDAEVRFSPDHRFVARILLPFAPLASIAGRWTVEEGIIVAAATIASSDAPLGAPPLGAHGMRR